MPSLFTRVLPCLLTLSLVGTLAAAQAPQPLVDLAPAETFATLGIVPGATMPATTLKQDLSELGWERAGKTLAKLGALSGDTDLRDLLGGYGGMGMGGLFGDQDGKPRSGFERCMKNEAKKSRLETIEKTHKSDWGEGLISVGASSFSPVPALTALLRVDPELEAPLTQLQGIIVRCSTRSGAEVKRLQEGGTPLLVIGNASDFPVVLSRVGTLFVAGTNPEAVRGVVRRAHGSSEPSLGDSPFYGQNAELLTRPGLNFALDAATLGDTVESLATSFADEETAPLVARLVASLRTLGSYAGTLGVEGNALTLESQLNVNPEGGDPELAALLLEASPAPELSTVPEDAYAASAAHVPLRRTFDYFDGWVKLIGQTEGEAMNLRQLAREELGIDLDTALFDWLGNDMTSVILEPLGTDLAPYLYGQKQVFALSTKGQAATEAGYAELRRVAERLVEASGPDAEESKLFLESATQNTTFGGIDITRTRFGPNIDIGTAFLGNTLLIGMPAVALEPAISAAQGYTQLLSDSEAFETIRAAMPPSVTGLSYSNVPEQLHGFSDLTRLFAQPLAFVALAGLSDLSGDPGAKGKSASVPTFADLLHAADLIPNTLEVFAEHTGAHSAYTAVEGNRQHSLSRLELK